MRRALRTKQTGQPVPLLIKKVGGLYNGQPQELTREIALRAPAIARPHSSPSE